MRSRLLDFLTASLFYLDPWSVVIPSIACGVFVMLTHSGSIVIRDETHIHQLATVFIRRITVAFCLIAIPLYAGVVSLFAYLEWGLDGAGEYLGDARDEVAAAWRSSWWMLPFMAAFPSFIRFCIARYLIPRIEAYKREFRLRVSGDQLSDVRTEIEQLKPKTYNPRDFYLSGQMFFGVDEMDQPVTINDDLFRKNHIKVPGPSQTGKGVVLAVLMDQVISKGWGLWVDDKKPDDFWLDIITESCARHNRPPPVILDLNGVGPGLYAPFAFGSKRERMERVIKAFSLLDTGNTADYYKRNERDVLYDCQDYWNGSLDDLMNILEGRRSDVPGEKIQSWKENSGSIRANLREWMQLETLRATKKNSLNVEDLLKSGTVVYIRSSLEDAVVKKAFMALLDEVVQIARRQRLAVPTTFAMDEIRFSAGVALANALATVLSKNLNFLLAYQTRSDLRNIDDKTANADSVSNGIELNSQITLSYRAGDEETAEWIAGLTGTIQKSAVQSESIVTDNVGTERWTGERKISRVEENYIHPNKLLILPPRIAVLIQPGQLAKVVFTSWIAVEKATGMPLRKHPSIPVEEPKEEGIEPVKERDETEKSHAKNENRDVVSNLETAHDAKIDPSDDGESGASFQAQIDAAMKQFELESGNLAAPTQKD